MNSTKFIPIWYKDHIEKVKMRKVYILMFITVSFTIILYKGQDNHKKEFEQYNEYVINQELDRGNNGKDHEIINKFLNVLNMAEDYDVNLICLTNEEDKLIFKIDYRSEDKFISRLSKDYDILSIIKENIEDQYYMEVIIK